MAEILELADTVPRDKVLQPEAHTVGATVAAAVSFLLAVALRVGPAIHATVGSVLAGFTYKAGANKKAGRTFDKIYQKYLGSGGARCVTDIVRGTVICSSFREMADAIRTVWRRKKIVVLRGKFSVDPGHDAADTGGYRDCQLLARLADGEGGDGHVYELQFVLGSMADIKGDEVSTGWGCWIGGLSAHICLVPWACRRGIRSIERQGLSGHTNR